MVRSTSGRPLPFAAVLIWMSLIATVADAVSVFSKNPTIEPGNVYNSSNTVLSTLVVSNGHCGLICDGLGDDQCQSFNVKPEGNEIRCELFDHQPHEIASIIPQSTDQFFEEQCEPLSVTAGVKVVKEGLEFVILVDHNRDVHRLTPASPRLHLIGRVEEVFVGYNQELDDLTFFESILPFGDIYLLRHEIWMYCYKVGDHSDERFTMCDERFPVTYEEAFPLKFSDSVSLMVNNANTFIVVLSDGFIKASYKRNDTITRLEDSFEFLGKKLHRCESKSSYEFCFVHEPFLHAASSGVSLDGDYVGLFIGAKMYTFDVVNNVILQRYAVCKNKDLNFFFEERP